MTVRAAAAAAIALLLAALPARAKDVELLQTPSYRIVGEPSPKLKLIANYLELSCADFVWRFRAGHGPGGRMAVRLFASGEDIAKRMGKNANRPSYPGLYSPGEKELWLDGRGSDDDLFRIIRHEGFHQFLAFHFGNRVPDWLNEGLAQYFEGNRLESGKIRLGWASADAVRSLDDRWAKPLRPKIAWLIAADYDAFHKTGDEWTNYATAWLLCAWLVEDAPNGPAILTGYLDDLARDPKAPFASRLGDPEKVEAALRAKLDAMLKRWEETGEKDSIPPPKEAKK